MIPSFMGVNANYTYGGGLQQANMAALNLASQATPELASNVDYQNASRDAAMKQAYFGAMNLVTPYLEENDKAEAKRWAKSFGGFNALA